MARESLNLSVESENIEWARRYSSEHETSISKLVNDFLANLRLRHENRGEVPPITRSLRGVASTDLDEEDYREHLWQKYGR